MVKFPPLNFPSFPQQMGVEEIFMYMNCLYPSRTDTNLEVGENSCKVPMYKRSECWNGSAQSKKTLSSQNMEKKIYQISIGTLIPN